ncbi:MULTISPECIES: IS5 family transposase [Micrococcaceae]|jgi:transposase|uniref:IS5 family transposase n=1 Tax=Micrococcaceae TaxID=1268 RepID=UPI00209736EA|nr:IS5 family transposase [Arthrobacter sp. H16F315]MDD1478719.1 IS5 family transposase [Arthrobacter sp. H16F315]MDD1478767.1 IS5 family transposase [Arthrobacter sp. H16F315]
MKDASTPRPYPSDLTDEQWALIAPMVPVKTGGRPAVHPRRRIVEAILYVDRTGCAWRMMPHDFPPWDTVYWYFKRWNADGTTDRIHDALRAAARDAAGRDPMASAGIVDAQSVKGADTVGKGSRGYDAGKKVNGRKRHVVVDTLGLLVVVLVTAASLQDRDGGRLVLDKARMKMPSIVLVWADGGYAGRCVELARRLLRITVQIVKKPEGQRTFEVLPRRWVVERTLSWLVRCRRLGHDYERLPAHAEAMVKWAMIGLMARRLAPASGRRPWQPGTPK